jgi:hypothetical protein
LTALVGFTPTLAVTKRFGGDKPLTLMLLLFAIAFLLADAFISPTPLPEVTLTTAQDGRLAKRTLLLRTDAAWFIASHPATRTCRPAAS